MLVIRLIRTGKKNAPSFRIVLTEKTAPPKSGKFLEILGNYNPRRPAGDGSRPKGQPAGAGRKEINLKKERIKYWLSQGAQASTTVHNLLVKEGLIKGPKIKKKISLKAGKKKAELKKEEKTAEPLKEEKETKETKEEKKKEPAEEKVEKTKEEPKEEETKEEKKSEGDLSGGKEEA